MVVRLHNVNKWQRLSPGEVLSLPGPLDQPRKVRLEVNCVEPTRFDVVSGPAGAEEHFFLAVVTGYQVLEFSVPGDVKVVPTTDGEVWFFTNDGDSIASKNVQAVPFTKIASRRTRNPDLELMMFKMEQNQKRREAALRAEMQALMAARTPHDLETGEVDDDMGSGGGAAGDEGTDDPPASGGAGADGEPSPQGGAAVPAAGA